LKGNLFVARMQTGNYLYCQK